MVFIRYKGHHILGHTHRDTDCEMMLRYKVKESREVEVSEREAKRLLHDYPTAFERVATGRTVEKPEHDRMQRRPKRKRKRRAKK